jgi:Fe-S cluster assembly protein SufD
MSAIVDGVTLKDKLLADFELQKTAFFPDNPVLSGFRNKAAEAFKHLGFPTKKWEEYKYLSFDSFVKSELNHSLTRQLIKVEVENNLIVSDANNLFLTDGFFDEKLNQKINWPEGVIVSSLADAIASKNVHALMHLGMHTKTDNDSFIALNTALFQDGLFVYIPENVNIEKTFQVIQLSIGNEPKLIQPRILVVTEKNSSANFIHLQVSSHNNETTLSNGFTEIVVGENAKVCWYSVQELGSNSGLVQTTEAYLQKNAKFETVTVSLTGKLIRNNLTIALNGSHSEAHLDGFYFPKSGETFDNHTLVDHQVAHCESNELYKGAVAGDGTAIFNGKVFVRQDAQKTNAYQSNKNILLSEDATVNTKPQLEIYADDVKCSHGSSTGFIDSEQLFYLRSRGISESIAKALLLDAYAAEVINKIKHEDLRNKLSEVISGMIQQIK